MHFLKWARRTANRFAVRTENRFDGFMVSDTRGNQMQVFEPRYWWSLRWLQWLRHKGMKGTVTFFLSNGSPITVRTMGASNGH